MTVFRESILMCYDAMCAEDAVCLAPQVAPKLLPPAKQIGFFYQEYRFFYLPVCNKHIVGWWDGLDDKFPWPPIMRLHRVGRVL